MLISGRSLLFRHGLWKFSNARLYTSQSQHQIFYTLTNDYHRKRSVNSDVLLRAIEQINANLSERLSLVILSTAARYVHHVTPQKRLEFLEKIWHSFEKQRVPLNIRHYETYLTGLNENGFLFDADVYFDLIRKGELRATPRLYSLLLSQYCRSGNVERRDVFLKYLQDEQIRLDEDIFAALIVGELKLKNFDRARELLRSMKENSAPPTISTYKEILTLLISEHEHDEFQHYFHHIDSSREQLSSISTLYIDPTLIAYLLGQAISFDEPKIFQFLLNRLKHLDYSAIGQLLTNLAEQCVAMNWHRAAIDLLQMRTKIESNDEENVHDKHWLLLFDQLIERNQLDLIETFMKLMTEMKLQPLDTLLRILYTKKQRNYPLALKLLERAAQLSHPMRVNYIYPLFLVAHSSTGKWNDDDRLRLYRFLDRSTIEFEATVFARLLQPSFQRFYGKASTRFWQILRENHLTKLEGNFARLLNNDVRRTPITHCDLTDEFIQQLSSCLTTNSTRLDIDIDAALISLRNSSRLDEVFEFFSTNCDKFSRENLISLAERFLELRPTEALRRFWRQFFRIFYARTNGDELIEFYSKAAKNNPQFPYLPLFELFIQENLLDHLQKVVDIASAQHGAQNVSHDLAFTMILNGKTKQAERIFQIPWFRAKNDRIRLHSLLFADEKNLPALIEAIKLTRDLPGVEPKSLFNAAIRLAIELDQTDLIHWLIEEMQQKNFQLETRHRKFINAHLLAKGLDPLETQPENEPNEKVLLHNGASCSL